ncbi:hypothetical protein [Magnetospirillum fulvum]|uniref:Methyl-accepting chemotaxis protein n=1 Tax=Magnetospirillum fulvum MGU-K5 TaxID=1316936 RepID=S9SBG2_MAGFU|nr:hypothetical protein [Magnetospirillum fulvum]EPY03242.1 hypothetical protein K678_01326 [Magnetospirillum fulvum MGU-K5]
MTPADPAPRRRVPPPEIPPAALATLAGMLGALGAAELFGAPSPGPAVAGFAAAAAMAAGLWLGGRKAAAETRLRQYRVADELAQYRAFTRLMRAQGERIVDQSAESALTIAHGLRRIDTEMSVLDSGLSRLEANGADPAEIESLRQAVAAAAEPVVGMLAALQFQDVTRQQTEFLARLSLLLEEHMDDLARMLGDRRSLDRTTRFKELFEQALNDTVMSSQRDDHRAANGIDLQESTGPAVELFFDEEGTK